MQALEEDKDAERKEDRNSGDGECSDAENPNCGCEAVVQDKHVTGGEVKRRKGGIRGGRGVD